MTDDKRVDTVHEDLHPGVVDTGGDADTDSHVLAAQSRSKTARQQDEFYRESLKGLRSEIQQLSKAPFRQILAEMLGCKPDLESLQDFANRQPDRWAQSVAIMAKNAGYEQKHTVEHNHSILIAEMSDAQLFAQLREAEQKLEALMGPAPAVLEHDPTTS
jgi:hypothetical protein